MIAKSKERGVIAQIEQLLSLNSCQLEFTNDAIKAIAELAFCKRTGYYIDCYPMCLVVEAVGVK